MVSKSDLAVFMILVLRGHAVQDLGLRLVDGNHPALAGATVPQASQMLKDLAWCIWQHCLFSSLTEVCLMLLGI